VSALIGYEDESWAVRNSATMVFAAAMLRVIDADKNQKASTSGNVSYFLHFIIRHCHSSMLISRYLALSI